MFSIFKWRMFSKETEMLEKPVQYMVTINCGKCSTYASHFENVKTSTKCSNCNEFKHLFSCRDYFNCDFETEICLKCAVSKSLQKETKSQLKPDNKKNTFLCILIAAVIGLLAISILIFKNSSELQKLPSITIIRKLRQQFPSQKNETWYHILSVLEQSVPTVKSITLLHKNGGKTSDCLARELVNIFNGSINIGEVSFDLDGIQYKDYGEVLEHYHAVVKRFRVLVTNLSIVPASIARVFHSLCDEVTSDIKPSLFIFTLQCDEEKENLKPMQKATGILKQAWSDLPDSDVFPLLSRIVKNVVYVQPEKQATC